MSELDQYEAYLVSMIQNLRSDYEKAAEPYFKRLAEVHGLRPLPPIFIEKNMMILGNVPMEIMKNLEES